MTYKILQGIGVSCTILILPASLRPEALYFPQLWIFAGLGVLATVFQPRYDPLKYSAGEDKGTAAQIIWSIYVTQLLIVVEAVYWRFPGSFRWDLPVAFALTAMFAGLFLRTWAFYSLGRQFSWHLNKETQETLITSGPFRYLRHPGYSGAFLTYVSTAVFLHAWFSFTVSLVLLAAAFARRIYYEEKLLAESFGTDYSEYQQKVKRVLPGIW